VSAVPLRDIDGVVERRGDISPYLVHLTKDSADGTLGAKAVLESIIQEGQLWPGRTEVSAIKYGGYTVDMDLGERRRFFGAICFTETPLDQLQAMIQIQSTGIRLSRYGLVFSKAALARKNVQPVCYLNNELGNKDLAVRTLFALIGSAPDVAEELLPLFEVFGQKIKGPHMHQRPQGHVDFRWEREWRRPAKHEQMVLERKDILMGLCPETECRHFADLANESLGVSGDDVIEFIDPLQSTAFNAHTITIARERLQRLTAATSSW
jgi:hypothetical protein